jgi:hypothetical protein
MFQEEYGLTVFLPILQGPPCGPGPLCGLVKNDSIMEKTMVLYEAMTDERFSADELALFPLQSEPNYDLPGPLLVFSEEDEDDDDDDLEEEDDFEEMDDDFEDDFEDDFDDDEDDDEDDDYEEDYDDDYEEDVDYDDFDE